MDDGVRKVKEFIAFTLCMLIAIFIAGFIICAILITYKSNQIVSFIVGVLGGIFVGWIFTHFWIRNILED